MGSKRSRKIKPQDSKLLIIAVIITIAFIVANRYCDANNNHEITEDTSSPKTISTSDLITDNGIPITKMELPKVKNTRTETLLEHFAYTLSYNKTHNTPNWSAWILTAERVNNPTTKRSDWFTGDPLLPAAYQVEYKDYTGSGYDRGHMCPSADMLWDKQANDECFYMSNMCPQLHRLNSGCWEDVENKCRKWATKEGVLYIACGPIYKKSKTHEAIGISHKVDVPDAFFKVILSLRKDHQKAIAFYFVHNEEPQPYTQAVKSVDEIEKLTGIDFFYNLDDNTEQILESKSNIRDWE